MSDRVKPAPEKAASKAQTPPIARTVGGAATEFRLLWRPSDERPSRSAILTRDSAPWRRGLAWSVALTAIFAGCRTWRVGRVSTSGEGRRRLGGRRPWTGGNLDAGEARSLLDEWSSPVRGLEATSMRARRRASFDEWSSPVRGLEATSMPARRRASLDEWASPVHGLAATSTPARRRASFDEWPSPVRGLEVTSMPARRGASFDECPQPSFALMARATTKSGHPDARCVTSVALAGQKCPQFVAIAGARSELVPSP